MKKVLTLRGQTRRPACLNVQRASLTPINTLAPPLPGSPGTIHLSPGANYPLGLRAGWCVHQKHACTEPCFSSPRLRVWNQPERCKLKLGVTTWPPSDRKRSHVAWTETLGFWASTRQEINLGSLAVDGIPRGCCPHSHRAKCGCKEQRVRVCWNGLRPGSTCPPTPGFWRLGDWGIGRGLQRSTAPHWILGTLGSGSSSPGDHREMRSPSPSRHRSQIIEMTHKINTKQSFPVRHYRASSYRDASSEWRQCVTRRKGSQSIPPKKHHDRANNHRTDPTLLFPRSGRSLYGFLFPQAILATCYARPASRPAW
jgi:hypothetical protein